MGAAGGGLGLRVQFATLDDVGDGPAIRVLYDGARLGSWPTSDLRSARLTPVRLTVSSGGQLTLLYGNATVFDALRVPGWAPLPSWELAFSAATGAGTDNHWIDSVQLRTGAHVSPTPTAVRLALNGQQYDGGVDGAPDAYYVYEEAGAG